MAESSPRAFTFRTTLVGGGWVGPSRSMGTFLRTWRTEWAGLSRAQVAIAVNARLPRDKQIPQDRFRRWEEGQPPKTTDELEALCEVMGTHGLAAVELEQFREAVFRACADRQYPGLLANDEWVHEDDVVEVARAAECQERRQTGSISIVRLVAVEHELSEAVYGEGANGRGRPQAKRQARALVHARTALALPLCYRGRSRQAGELAAGVLRLIDTQLGGHNPTGNSRAWWQARALQAHLDSGSPALIGRLFAMSRDAQARGDWDLATQALAWAAQKAITARRNDLVDYAWENRALLLRGDEPFFVGWLAAARGLPREVEPYLEHYERWRDRSDSMAHFMYYRSMAGFARAAGAHDEAAQHAWDAITIARRWGWSGCERQAMRDFHEAEGQRSGVGRNKKLAIGIPTSGQRLGAASAGSGSKPNATTGPP